jgi:hypothetical protein
MFVLYGYQDDDRKQIRRRSFKYLKAGFRTAIGDITTNKGNRVASQKQTNTVDQVGNIKQALSRRLPVHIEYNIPRGKYVQVGSLKDSPNLNTRSGIGSRKSELF